MNDNMIGIKTFYSLIAGVSKSIEDAINEVPDGKQKIQLIELYNDNMSKLEMICMCNTETPLRRITAI